MLIIKIKEGENIDRAIKRYRKKHRNVKLLRELRDRKQYKKPSIQKREQLIKAKYIEQLKMKE
ncbi:30S ribosomal protein S21 [uncultured Tenacibaculum sp.]|uniref:30S ribosomal protein S21 n=1 Tax=uncultured Tenacibaculum sp. TaxID=174713 RepID=UPI002615286D|nr:30S ribosomal protein S21 [uncultured Tenacibaculum sp.]